MSVRITGWTIVGTILSCIAVLLIIVAHALPYWEQAEKRRDTGIPNVGLWQICFREDGYPAPVWANDALGNRYYGCNFLFDRDLRFIRSWFYTSWFLIVVIFVSLGVLLQPGALILNILYYVRVCSQHYEHILLLVSSIINFTVGLLVAIAIVIFGLRSARDEYWIPLPESNHLSYAFAICALVPPLCFLSSTFHLVDYLRLKSFRDHNARAKVYSKGQFANRF